jgi:hypothetical protein
VDTGFSLAFPVSVLREVLGLGYNPSVTVSNYFDKPRGSIGFGLAVVAGLPGPVRRQVDRHPAALHQRPRSSNRRCTGYRRSALRGAGDSSCRRYPPSGSPPARPAPLQQRQRCAVAVFHMTPGVGPCPPRSHRHRPFSLARLSRTVSRNSMVISLTSSRRFTTWMSTRWMSSPQTSAG